MEDDRKKNVQSAMTKDTLRWSLVLVYDRIADSFNMRLVRVWRGGGGVTVRARALVWVCVRRYVFE